MPPPSAKGALSRRGMQLAAATVLGVVTVLLVLGVVLLGIYEARSTGGHWLSAAVTTRLR